MDLFAVADTQAGIRNTGWAAVQAVTEQRDWLSKARGATDDAKNAARFARSVGLTTVAGINEPKAQIRERVLALV